MAPKFCPNISLPESKALINKLGLLGFYKEYIKNGYNIPDINSTKAIIEQVDALPKAVDIITKNLSKINQWFNNKAIDKDTLWKKVQELGVPKNQIELLKSSEGETINDVLLDFISNNVYGVEINISKERVKNFDTRFINNEFTFLYNGNSYEKIDEALPFGDESDIKYYKDNSLISEEEYNKAFTEANKDSITEFNSQHYSNLTVPGGTNYTENEISTPSIVPSIKGHAQFATDNGIGWFRSDEKDITIPSLINIQGKKAIEEYRNAKLGLGDTSSKTKRILEVQSDLFQKGRDARVIVQEKFNFIKDEIITTDKGRFKILKITVNPNTMVEYYHLENIDTGIQGSIEKTKFENRILETNGKSTQNNFLQLLNKDNNWVTFFIKSIIQDSAKKGYEKILFPTGNTASKIEGHTTLEEFKKEKELQLTRLKNQLGEAKHSLKNPEDKYIESVQGYQTSRVSHGDLDTFKEILKTDIEKIDREIIQLELEIKRVDEEGFGALKPIYNFYENTVANILNKQYGKDNVKLITDEYGNTWNEINIDNTSNNTVFYDINPQSVITQLFVDIDTFTIKQQNEIIDTIIYQIDQAKSEGITDVDEIFDYIKDLFDTQGEEFREANTDGSLNEWVRVYNSISDNWPKFVKFTKDKLKRIGVKIVSGKIDDTSTSEINEDNQDLQDIAPDDPEADTDNFVLSEADYQRDNYDDGFIFSRSSKDTASAHLKLKLSSIPEVEYVDGVLQKKENFLGMTAYMPLDKVWETLLRELTPLEIDQIYPRLNELAKENPMYAEILNQIFSDANVAIQNEFLVTFSQQQARFITAKIGLSDKLGNTTISVFGTNRQGAESIIIEDWLDRFKKSKLVNNIAGNLVVNTDNAKKLLENYDKVISKTLTAKQVQHLFEIIGIKLSDIAVENFVKYGVTENGVDYKASVYLARRARLIFDRLAGNLKQTEVDLENKFDYNNPFISEATTINTLAKLELTANPSLYESSFIAGDGKTKYSYVKNSYLSKLFKKLKGDRGVKYMQDLATTSYASKSVWINKYLNDSRFSEVFGLEYFDTLGTYVSKQKGKLFREMSTKEKEFARISLFQNQGRKGIAKFFGLIPSDKTTIPVITALKTNVVVTENGVGREALNDLYTGFISEYNRISDVIKQENQDIDHIHGYHDIYEINPKTNERKLVSKGQGRNFLIFDFLNGDKELFDAEGNLRLIDDVTLKNIVTPKIQKFVVKSIKNQLDEWNRLGLQGNNIFDKSFLSSMGFSDEIKSIGNIKSILRQANRDKTKDESLLKEINRLFEPIMESFAADYVVNNFIAAMNYTQVIGGDPALHGKKTIEATWINYSKRMAKDIAPGLDGNFNNPNYTVLFLKDALVDSKHLIEYTEVLGEKVNAYKNMNIADAQEYTTLKEHLAVMDAYGKLTPDLKAAGQRLLEGGELQSDIDLILQPMKPVQVGFKVDKELGINRAYYIKTSSFPLIPSLTKGLEIDNLRVKMENEGIDRAIYESGVKLGLSGKLDEQTVVLNRDIFRLQQEIPYHGEENYINEGSQARKLLLTDIEDEEAVDLVGAKTGKEAKDLYEALHVEKMNRAFDKFLNDIGATKANGNLEIKDLTKLQEVLIEEATSRGYNINDIYGLQIENINGKQRFIVPLGFNTSSSRLESILNALVTNRVIKQELPGFAKVQGSSFGFSKIAGLEDINEVIKDSISWLNPNDTTLNYIRKSEDGKTLLQADILVPSWFKDESGNLIDIKQFIKEDGSLDTDKIPESLLTIIGIRIPTQGLNSIMSFKVKGFLPKLVGDLAVVPAEIVAQMGSDFDVDKLFIYRYEYEVKNGIYSKVEFDSTKELKKQSIEQLNNAIVQFYEDRYKDVSLLSKILEPNGFGKLPELATTISKKLGLDKSQHFLLPTTQNQIHKNNNDGKAGTGIFSLFSTFIRAAQDAKLDLNKSVSFMIEDKKVSSNQLYSKGLGQSPSATISYFQSASVDNAKEQILGYLNINNQSMDVAGTIALLGFDEEYIAYFLSQPIIREYVEAMSNINDITNPVYTANKEGEVLFFLHAKLLAKINKTPYDVDAIKVLNEYENEVLSLEDLIAELDEETNKQITIFQQFISIKNSAKKIRSVMSAINTDTSGLGARFTSLQVKTNQIDLVKETEAIDGVNRLFGNNVIGKSEEILRTSLQLFSQVLPYETLEYKSATNSILELQGKADAEVNVKELDLIYSHIKSFIYSDSNLLNIDDINKTRETLLFSYKGNQSLGDRWIDYIESPSGKKNLLAERIKVRRGDNATDPILLETINTPAAANEDTNAALADFYRMYFRGTDLEQELAKDLIKYYILTGAQSGLNNIGKYIPYDVLEEFEFGNKLNTINNQLQTTDYSLYNAVEQFFQHNPSKAIGFDETDKSISEKKYLVNNILDSYSLSRDSKYEIPVFLDFGKKIFTYPTYMSRYDSANKNFILYKLNSATDQLATYTRIDTLGNGKNLLEYNVRGTQYSLISDNQSGNRIPIEQNQVIKEEEEVQYEKATREVTYNDLVNNLQLDNNNLETTLNTIIDNPTKSEYINIAKDLKTILTGQNISIGVFDRAGVSGYYTNNKISINLSNILRINPNNSLEKAQKVILHETIHAITVNKIANYDNLSSKDKIKVDSIRKLFTKYRGSVNQEELKQYEQLVSRYTAQQNLTDTELQFLSSNKEKYYPLTSLEEFIAAGLTDDIFVQELKDNNFWKDLWDSIMELLGLNREFANDYEALYTATIELGGSDTSIDEFYDLNPDSDAYYRRQFVLQKAEFLKKYKKKISQRVSIDTLIKIKNSAEANSKYDLLHIWGWDNSRFLELRVSYKEPKVFLDINPEEREKTPEEKFIEVTLKRLYSFRTKLKNSVKFKTDAIIQNKVASLDNDIKKLKEKNSVVFIISDIKDKLDMIQERLDTPDLINIFDIDESERYLSFYQNIQDYITFDESFESLNSDLEYITKKAKALIPQLRVKSAELLFSELKSKIKIPGINFETLLNSPTKDVGNLESNLQSGAFSSSQVIQLLQEYIENTQMRTNEEFTKVEHGIKELVKVFLKKYKNYDILLQKDKNGKPTGRLLNKYSQAYYDKLKSLEGKKEYAKFFKANTKVELTKEGKEAYDKDLQNIKDTYSNWDIEGTLDNDNYLLFIYGNDPNSYIQAINKGRSTKELQGARRYVTERPIDIWLDSNYQKLKALPESDPARMLYDLLDSELRSLNKKYHNQVNYIPEIRKDLIAYMLKGNWKGGFSNIKGSIIDSIFSTVEPQISSQDLDINGKPHDTIPVYMMSDILSPDQKSYDLGNILLATKAQETALAHKAEVEPYILIMQRMIQDLKQYQTNQSGEIAIDSESQLPLLDNTVGRNKNLNDQARWMIEDYLYNNGSKQSVFNKKAKVKQKTTNTKGEEVEVEKVLTGSKVADTLGAITRLKGMGLNPFSGFGNLVFGLISNAVYSGDRRTFNEGDSLKAFGLMLNAAVPGSKSNKKVDSLMKFFDVLVQTNDIKYNQFDLKSPENPLNRLSFYEFQKRGEYFVQGQTAMAILFNKKIKNNKGQELNYYEAFDNEGNWKSEFGENPFNNFQAKLDFVKEIKDTIAEVHGDYARGLKAKEHWLGRALLIFRTWLPQSVASRFGNEYTDLRGVTRKGRYKSYKLTHLAILPLIQDMFNAFNTSVENDTVDTRNLRKNAIELAFIPMLWAAGLLLKSLIKSGDEDDDDELLTFVLNSTLKASNDLTFFMNPYSFKAVTKEPIPAFKTLMDAVDLLPAVINVVQGEDTYKSGRRKGKSKFYKELVEVFPLINQPGKFATATQEIFDKD